MNKELKINIEQLSKDGKEVFKQIIRLEVAYSEQSKPKKEVRSLFDKAYSLLMEGKLKAAIDTVTAIIKAIQSFYDPP